MSSSNPPAPTNAEGSHEHAALPDPCRDPKSPCLTEGPDHMQPVPFIFRIGQHWGCKSCKGMHTIRGFLLFGKVSCLKTSIGAAAHKVAELKHHHEIESDTVQVAATKAVISPGAHATRKVDKPLMGQDLMQLETDEEASEMGQILKARGEERKGLATIVAISFQLKAVARPSAGFLLSRTPTLTAPNEGAETALVKQEESTDDAEQYKRDMEELEKIVKKEEEDDQWSN